MSLKSTPFWQSRITMGVNERMTVWKRKIQRPRGDVGLKRQMPFEMVASSVTLLAAHVEIGPPDEE